MNGTIRKKTDKGFGFIKGEDGKEYFFHHSQCRTEFEGLREGDKVLFDSVKSEKGPRATDVEWLSN